MRPARLPARSVSVTTTTTLEAELQDSIAPGHSGIVALVSDPGVVEIRRALDLAEAIVERAVDKVAAEDMKAAAKEAEAQVERDEG